MVTKST